MWHFYLTASALLAIPLAGCSGRPSAPGPATRPTASAVSERPVIGLLGLPLGTVAEIRATVVKGPYKVDQGRYLLRVTEVNGKPLAGSPVLRFGVPPGGRVTLPADRFELHELKAGRKVGQLEGAQIAEDEKGYVGKQVRLIAYETGGYSGIPDHLPDDVPVWQDTNFFFSTSLLVVAERGFGVPFFAIASEMD